ncbi:o-succinylbenzoate synthase [Falsochrobactrum shanghaiense]|uniref:o-succinylbenzoate synthase n=1 Tax=Falsochrobactrum shanghaiense TaxID=2201899 RepID=A0A316J792_9HYPH|nr:o-succinylbenzoate synthase [Falsochrobactrum shanghaiense]PWL17574.1 o-succinylbenzoate synthase [Falsochrobactrum shanghaiense]
MHTTPIFAGLKIEAAEIRVIRLPLLVPFVISTGTMTEKIIPILTLRAEGLEGYAEGVMDPLPDYLEETISGSLSFLRDVLLPQIVGKRFAGPADLFAILDPWRGHRMSKAMVEMAVWDLWAKALNLPLSVALGGVRDAIDVGVSLGIADIPTTVDRVAASLDAGYKRVKLKIKRGHDLAMIEAVRERFPEARLTVDANTDYRLSDLPLLKAMDAFALDYIEQPLAFDDITDHVHVQEKLLTAICLDESIRSSVDARKALVARACRVINIKVGRVGGHSASRAIHDVCAAFDVPVWCGGMLEAGIGRAHNIHLSTLPNFTKPGDTSSASRYFPRDIVNEPLEAENGRMAVPRHGPGIGVTLDHAFLDTVTSHREDFVA